MTESTADRLAELQRRRTASAAGPTRTPQQQEQQQTRKRRRRHVAQGSRILAAGLGATTMFGIVTILGLDNPVSGANDTATTVVTPDPATAPPVAPVAPVVAVAPPVQVVIHRVPVTDPGPTEPVAAAVDAVDTTLPAGPIQLTANPVVQTITVAAPSQPRQGSSGSSSGSSASAAAPAPAPAAPAAKTSGS